MNKNILNLTNSSQGKEVKVVNIDGGDATQKRLKDLGILNNETIFIVKNDKVGPVIILVKGSKIALGRNISGNIQVEVNYG
jgi:ferrous iron transport protein A